MYGSTMQIKRSLPTRASTTRSTVVGSTRVSPIRAAVSPTKAKKNVPNTFLGTVLEAPAVLARQTASWRHRLVVWIQCRLKKIHSQPNSVEGAVHYGIGKTTRICRSRQHLTRDVFSSPRLDDSLNLRKTLARFYSIYVSFFEILLSLFSY